MKATTFNARSPEYSARTSEKSRSTEAGVPGRGTCAPTAHADAPTSASERTVRFTGGMLARRLSGQHPAGLHGGRPEPDYLKRHGTAARGPREPGSGEAEAGRRGAAAWRAGGLSHRDGVRPG